MWLIRTVDCSKEHVVVAFANGLLVSMTTGTTSPQWVRMEGLADIAATSFLDLPPDEAEQELFGTEHNPLSSLTRRWLSTVSDIGRLATGLAEENEDQLVTDLFRLHKMLVVTDAAGTIYGLDSRRGQVRYVMPADGSQAVVKASLHQLKPTANGASVVACMHYYADGSGAVMFFDGLTGQPSKEPTLARQAFPVAVAAHTLPATTDGMAILGVVDGDNTLHLFPSTSSANRALQATTHAVHFHKVDPVSGLLTGSVIHNGTVNQLWQIEFSPETERIVAMASAPAGERTASAVSRMLTLMTQGLSNVIIGGYSWRQNSLVQVPEPQLVGSGHTNPLC
eukprot:m.128182 g.128182  ORF g.128182 m.128182 type:complete len:338 (+) comp15823_c2_seq5:1079-2092(+)